MQGLKRLGVYCLLVVLGGGLSGCWRQDQRPDNPPVPSPVPAALPVIEKPTQVSAVQVATDFPNYYCVSLDTTDDGLPMQTIKVMDQHFAVATTTFIDAQAFQAHAVGTPDTIYWWQEQPDRQVSGSSLSYSGDGLEAVTESTSELLYLLEPKDYSCQESEFFQEDFQPPADINF